MTETNRWWYCLNDFAVNDGNEGSQCWNCGWVMRARKHIPWCTMSHKKCTVCGLRYVTWTLPPDTVLRGEPYEMGFCPKYFQDDHAGAQAYFPPMLPAVFVLEANGYESVDGGPKVRKVRRR